MALQLHVTRTAIPEVMVLTPDVATDERGTFYESFNTVAFSAATGLSPNFVQENHTHSVRNVLRGMHYQVRHPQGKLVRVVSGEIFDVVVDLRRGSPTFGKSAGVVLTAAGREQLWVPEGFAHGYLVLSDTADVIYKTTDHWYPEHERSIAWNDPDLNIAWPLEGEAVVSARDRAAGPWRTAEVFS